jgi:hypothetical protein
MGRRETCWSVLVCFPQPAKNLPPLLVVFFKFYLMACPFGWNPVHVDFWTYLLSCMHWPIQPKSLNWWGEVSNSLIFQHSPSSGGSVRPQTWNRSEQQLFYLIALTRIQTWDLCLWYHIKLHAPTNSTQKLKLMGRGGNSLIFQQYWMLPNSEI